MFKVFWIFDSITVLVDSCEKSLLANSFWKMYFEKKEKQQVLLNSNRCALKSIVVRPTEILDLRYADQFSTLSGGCWCCQRPKILMLSRSILWSRPQNKLWSAMVGTLREIGWLIWLAILQFFLMLISTIVKDENKLMNWLLSLV